MAKWSSNNFAGHMQQFASGTFAPRCILEVFFGFDIVVAVFEVVFSQQSRLVSVAPVARLEL
jgi:hypothetical protein